MQKILYVIMVLFIFTMIPVFAQTNPITIQTDSSIYEEGDTIAISGKVNTVVSGTPVVLQIFFEGNLVDVAQITIAQDGTYAHTVISKGPLWNKTGDYLIRASYGEGNISELEFNFSSRKEVKETTETFEVDAGTSGTFDVEYTIRGGTVKNMAIDKDVFSLIVQIDSTNKGNITMKLPREFIGAERQDGKDDVFIIIIDGMEAPYQESVTDSDIRIITIDFEQGDSDIEVIGTYVIPEFGTFIMIVLIIGIASSLLITRNRFQFKI